MIPFRHARLSRPLARGAAVLAAAFVALPGHAGGLDIHTDADASQVGLPAYPGAVKRTDHEGDNAGFSFGVWGASFGLKVAAVSYRSEDGVDKVAAFYRDALGRYGPVLDCSANPGRHDGTSHEIGGKDGPVTCDDDHVAAGGRLYKVGTNHAQRVVKIRPWHDGAAFELVDIEEHGTD